MKFLLSALALAALTTPALAAKPQANAHVGVTTRIVHPKDRRNWRGDPEKDLRCTIWYPAAESAVETKQFVGPADAPLFEAGMAAPQAPFGTPPKHGWPLVLLSHGSGGSAIQMAWLGSALARAGYIAVAVDHPGNNANQPMTPEGLALWWERATDLSQVLDAMLVDEEFGTHIDQSRIAAAGYSLGGYTVLALAGAQTDISAFFNLCRAKPSEQSTGSDTAVCQLPELRGMGSIDNILKATRKTSAESLARSGELYSDERIGAVFAIAPALAFTFTDESVHAIPIPVEIVVGDADRIADADNNADYLVAYDRKARMTLLPNVGHYTFLDVCTAAGTKTFPRYCTDEKGIEREAIHAKVAAQAIAFFNRTLH
jgi:predicted dienelactone hydrolase